MTCQFQGKVHSGFRGQTYPNSRRTLWPQFLQTRKLHAPEVASATVFRRMTEHTSAKNFRGQLHPHLKGGPHGPIFCYTLTSVQTTFDLYLLNVERYALSESDRVNTRGRPHPAFKRWPGKNIPNFDRDTRNICASLFCSTEWPLKTCYLVSNILLVSTVWS